jgi:hypothetical protein
VDGHVVPSRHNLIKITLKFIILNAWNLYLSLTYTITIISPYNVFLTLISTEGDFNNIRQSSDIAILLTSGGKNSCGVAYFDTISYGITMGVVAKDCATGYYSFGHEIAHMYGCDHNREVAPVNSAYENAHGFLMNPPVNSGFRTIMA